VVNNIIMSQWVNVHSLADVTPRIYMFSGILTPLALIMRVGPPRHSSSAHLRSPAGLRKLPAKDRLDVPGSLRWTEQAAVDSIRSGFNGTKLPVCCWYAQYSSKHNLTSTFCWIWFCYESNWQKQRTIKYKFTLSNCLQSRLCYKTYRFLESLWVYNVWGIFKFWVQGKPDTKFRPRENILYTILPRPITSFSVNYRPNVDSIYKHTCSLS